MKILFDTNLWISFMIGKRLSSLADVLCRHDVEVYVCEQEFDEIRRVIAREKFDKLISAETRYYFFEMVYDICFITDITVEAKSDSQRRQRPHRPQGACRHPHPEVFRTAGEAEIVNGEETTRAGIETEDVGTGFRS